MGQSLLHAVGQLLDGLRLIAFGFEIRDDFEIGHKEIKFRVKSLSPPLLKGGQGGIFMVRARQCRHQL